MARTGRPRAFDADEVVDAALTLFWEHGYDGTSMAMLLEATGLSSASFYGAFNSKKAIFDAALARYVDGPGSATAALTRGDLAPRAAVEASLRDSATMQTSAGRPRGCLATLSGLLVDEESACPDAVEYRDRVRHAYRARVREAVSAGQLDGDVDVAGLATLLECVQWGIAVDARDGVPTATLLAAVEQAMRAWDGWALPTGRPCA